MSIDYVLDIGKVGRSYLRWCCIMHVLCCGAVDGIDRPSHIKSEFRVFSRAELKIVSWRNIKLGSPVDTTMGCLQSLFGGSASDAVSNGNASPKNNGTSLCLLI